MRIGARLPSGVIGMVLAGVSVGTVASHHVWGQAPGRQSRLKPTFAGR